MEKLTKEEALLKVLVEENPDTEIDIDDIIEEYGSTYTYDGVSYLILDEQEREEYYTNYAKGYVEDCVQWEFNRSDFAYLDWYIDWDKYIEDIERDLYDDQVFDARNYYEEGEYYIYEQY